VARKEAASCQPELFERSVGITSVCAIAAKLNDRISRRRQAESVARLLARLA
jgi:hypothetical protein